MIDFSPAKANTAFRELDDGRTSQTLDQKIKRQSKNQKVKALAGQLNPEGPYLLQK